MPSIAIHPFHSRSSRGAGAVTEPRRLAEIAKYCHGVGANALIWRN